MLTRRSSVALAMGLLASGVARAQVPGIQQTPRVSGPPTVNPNNLTLYGVDLRPQAAAKGLTVRSQGARPTCTLFATTFLIEYMQAFSARGDHHGSVEYMVWAANEAMGKADDGAFFEDVVAGYSKHGAVADAILPYGSTFTGAAPGEAVRLQGLGNRQLTGEMIRPWDGSYGVSDAQIETMKAYLRAGVPVAGGFRLTGTPETVTIGDVQIWNTLPNLDGLYWHSMAVVGYQLAPAADGGGYFIIRNSGGPNSGDNGHLYCSFNFFKAHVADVIVFKTAPPAIANLPRSIQLNPAPRLPIAPLAVVNSAASRSRRVTR